MVDGTRNYFFGCATDNPPKKENKMEYVPYAVNDLVYFFKAGEPRGILATFNGYSYDENGSAVVYLTIGSTGEQIETRLSNIRF